MVLWMVRFSFVLTTNYIGRFQLHNELLSFAWRWINRSIDSSCVFGWIDNGRQPILPGGHSIFVLNPFYCNLCNFSSADGMEAKKIERQTVVDFMRISAKWQTMRLSTKLLLTTGIECLFVQRLWNFVCVSAHRIDVRLHHSRQKMILNAWRTTAAGWADEWLSDISLKSFYAYSWNS